MTNMLAQLSDEVMANIDAVLPPVGERVIVQSDGFRCVATCDVNGRWLDAYNNQALSGVRWFKPLGTRK